MGITETIANPVFGPLLNLHPGIAIIIVSFLVSLIITLIYKAVTNQEEMKRLKEKLKEHQKQMKESKEDHGKVMSLQKETMKTNMEYMKHSLKPTLITLLPIILIFGWLNAHYAFMPIMPGDEFSLKVSLEENSNELVRIVTPNGIDVADDQQKPASSGNVEFFLKAVDKGDYFVDVEYRGDIFSKEIIISEEQEYAEQSEIIGEKGVKSITIGYEKLTPLGNLSIFGWKPGWLGLYITFSLIFSMGLRKLMKLH